MTAATVSLPSSVHTFVKLWTCILKIVSSKQTSNVATHVKNIGILVKNRGTWIWKAIVNLMNAYNLTWITSVKLVLKILSSLLVEMTMIIMRVPWSAVNIFIASLVSTRYWDWALLCNKDIWVDVSLAKAHISHSRLSTAANNSVSIEDLPMVLKVLRIVSTVRANFLKLWQEVWLFHESIVINLRQPFFFVLFNTISTNAVRETVGRVMIGIDVQIVRKKILVVEFQLVWIVRTCCSFWMNVRLLNDFIFVRHT